MIWNWQQPDWPHFTFKKAALERLEAQFLRQSGVLVGISKHIRDDDRQLLTIDLMSDEAIKTSEIEGEHLNRDSVRSSFRKHFGLTTETIKVPDAERGIVEMMIDLYGSSAAALTKEALISWHRMITAGRTDLTDIGRYRTHPDPMQVVSGPIQKGRVHFEAPPSADVAKEMEQFLAWFALTAPDGAEPWPALTRAGAAHLYFVCIHPFEDGNGRIGRGIAEKVLSESLGQPTLIALSRVLQKNRSQYYRMLELSNKDNEITEWLVYFAETILDAQRFTQASVEFLLEKTKLYDKIRGKINARQDKVLARMFREGLDGFKGGLSADNYIRITDTSRATATRDLQELVELGALKRTGERKSTRYRLGNQGNT